MTHGYVNLVLHAHLPYVRHLRADRLEHRWLFEAITECYLPLLDVLEGLVRDRIPFRLTVSLSPTLMAMLADPLLQHRYASHLRRLIALAEEEIRTHRGQQPLTALAEGYRERFGYWLDVYENRYGRNLLAPFKRLAEQGVLELITTTATHAFLPYCATEAMVRAQIALGLREFVRHMGVCPRGLWLPECAYRPGLDRVLRDFGIRYTFVDAHALRCAVPAPPHDVYAPVETPEGVVMFARDPEASAQVWSNVAGYPGDPDYREYYRDIGYERPQAYLDRFLQPAGVRAPTGIKYWRVTGRGEEKEPYAPERADAKARAHAAHFWQARRTQLAALAERMATPPIATVPFDAELFGHWWYEGPRFLDALLREAAGDGEVAFTTPSCFLERFPPRHRARLPFSSWGRNGYGEVWLNGKNDWVYPLLHRRERVMIRVAERYREAASWQKRALRQALRELLLAQSSDWPFILDGQTAVPYATERVLTHVRRFDALVGMVEGAHPRSEAKLALWEAETNPLFVDGVLVSQLAAWAGMRMAADQAAAVRRVLMLTWEFPPRVVGGLARHVAELSRALVRQGIEVHVVTCAAPGVASEAEWHGVRVFRVPVDFVRADDFLHWVDQFNLAAAAMAGELMEQYTYDCLHAHDWLVERAARALRRASGLPLVTTIHATEHGRFGGLHTAMQRTIHGREAALVASSDHVIVCSQAMWREVQHVFGVPSERLTIIPNGVDRRAFRGADGAAARAQLALPSGKRLIVFVGRLVHEKGVHVLLSAVPEIAAHCPDVHVVVVGKGPMQPRLEDQARALGIEGRVTFTGFVSDETRNALLTAADVAVFPSLYEPFGIVALEAMAAGVPVVVAHTGGLAEIVRHEENGLTANPGDSRSLAEQVVRALTDDRLRRRIAEAAARDVATVYDWDGIARRTLGVYRIAAAQTQTAIRTS
nr:DUF1957 domain-containing protein [Bacillota bacterium]